MIELQYQLAAERSQQSQKPNFSHLIWLPGDLVIEDERQRTFVDWLRNDPQGAELLQTSLEELKTVIQDRLSPPKPEPIPSPDEELIRIYLICDQRDLNDIAPLTDYLFDQGFEPIVPLFEGDEVTVSQEHRENLRLCDAFLIYYGQADEAWLRGKLHDLRKAPGYRHTSPIRATAVYVAGPETPRKAHYRTHEVDEVISNFGGFSANKLNPFLAKIKQHGNPD